MVKISVTVLWIVCLGLALHAVTGETWRFAKRDYALLEAPPLVDLDTRLITAMTLGNVGVYDDVIYLWTLQSLVDPRLKTKDPVAVQESILRVTRHNPKIETLYMMSCFVLAFDLKRPDLCERITLDGLKATPDGWRIPITQGFIFAHELKDPKNAAMYYGLAASRPDAPPFVGRYAKKLIDTNELSIEELQATLDELLSAEEGSRFATFMEHVQPSVRVEGQKS